MWAVKIQTQPFLTSTLYTGELSAAGPECFTFHGKRLLYTLISGLGDPTDGLNAGANKIIFQPLPANEQFLGRPARSLGSVPNHAEHYDRVVKQILFISYSHQSNSLGRNRLCVGLQYQCLFQRRKINSYNKEQRKQRDRT